MTDVLQLVLNEGRHAARAQTRQAILEAFGESLSPQPEDGIHALDRITLRLAGLLSPDDARRLEQRLLRLDGVENALVRFRDETAIVTVRDGRLDAAGLQFVIEASGFGSWRVAEAAQTPEELRALGHRRLFFSVLLTALPGAVVLGISLFVRGLGWGSFWLQSVLTDAQLFFTLATLWFGRDLFLIAAREIGWRSAAREVPLALAAAVALGASLFTFFGQSEPMFEVAASLVAAYHVGAWIESGILRRAERHFRHLIELRPSWAIVRRDKADFRIHIRDLIVDDRVIVPAGGIIPVDGVLLTEGGVVDESALLGEGFSVQKGRGKPVYAGTTNGESEIVVAPRRTGSSTVLGHILRVVEDARDTRAQVQKRGDRVAAVVAPFTLLLAVATFIWWRFHGLALGESLWFALLPALAVLVVTTPWALGWASAVSVMAGMTHAAKKGVLFRDAESLEDIRNVDMMLFEKAGTLTSDRPEVESIQVVAGTEPRDALRLILALESKSSHAVAKAFLRYAKEHMGADVLEKLPEVQGLRRIPGRGVMGRVGGREIAMGTRALLEDKFIEVPPAPEADATGTFYYLAIENQTCARALLFDALRKDAVASVARVKAAGVRTFMVTSADVASALKVADAVGIAAENVRAEIDTMEHGQVARVARAAGYQVGVVGNSDSDQPSLSAAHVAFASIPRGGRLPKERYSVALLRPGSGGVVTAFDVASRTFRVIRRNIFGSALIMLAGVPAAMGVLPVYAATGLMLAGVAGVGIHGLFSRSA